MISLSSLLILIASLRRIYENIADFDIVASLEKVADLAFLFRRRRPSFPLTVRSGGGWFIPNSAAETINLQAARRSLEQRRRPTLKLQSHFSLWHFVAVRAELAITAA
jgi:hypothetical protein